jgi:hypothetical protein
VGPFGGAHQCAIWRTVAAAHFDLGDEREVELKSVSELNEDLPDRKVGAFWAATQQRRFGIESLPGECVG